ncbi:hypothetical protein CHUAL_008932 [Chamberlinius hualienensis]
MMNKSLFNVAMSFVILAVLIEKMSCTNGFCETRAQPRKLIQPPCDVESNVYCTEPGSIYPRRAVRQFVSDNQGLMKRMYGDLRHLSVLRSEMESNSVREQSFTAERTISSPPGASPPPVPAINNITSVNNRTTSNVTQQHTNDSSSTITSRNQSVNLSGFTTTSTETTTADKGINACPIRQEVVAPYWAVNTRGRTLAIVNDPPYEQHIHWEKCLNEKEQMLCRDGCRCEQQYRLQRLLAYDPSCECKGVFMDWFLLPSCCVCRCYGLTYEQHGVNSTTTKDAWVLGWWACKTVPYLQGVSVSASINTLVAISLDRFIVICRPMKWQITSGICRLIILIIWVFSCTITLPWALYFTLRPMQEGPNEEEELQMCQENWPDDRSDVIFFIIAHMLIDYLLPLVVISVCYIFIWFKVWKRRLPGETKDQNQDQMIHRSKIKVVKMLMAVVIMFALSWLPLYAVFARLKLGGPMESGSNEEKFVSLAVPVTQWLGASNSCVNPILYAFFNNKFRAGFKALLTANNKCCGPLRYDYIHKHNSTFRSKNSIETKHLVLSHENNKTVSTQV